MRFRKRAIDGCEKRRRASNASVAFLNSTLSRGKRLHTFSFHGEGKKKARACSMWRINLPLIADRGARATKSFRRPFAC